MNNTIISLLVQRMRKAADDLEAGNCSISMEQAENIIATFSHIEMTKEQICDEFELSRATFDRYVHDGYIPRGIKIKHKTNLYWYKDEVEQGLKRLKR